MESADAEKDWVQGDSPRGGAGEGWEEAEESAAGSALLRGVALAPPELVITEQPQSTW